jgi:hypothetical protein
MASEIAVRCATSSKRDEWVTADAIDAAIQEACKPLVEAVLDYARNYPAPSYSIQFDNMVGLVTEALKLKGVK